MKCRRVCLIVKKHDHHVVRFGRLFPHWRQYVITTSSPTKTKRFATNPLCPYHIRPCRLWVARSLWWIHSTKISSVARLGKRVWEILVEVYVVSAVPTYRHHHHHLSDRDQHYCFEALRCPSANPEEVHFIHTITLVIACISLPCALFLFLTMLCFKSRRPQRMVFWFSAPILVATIVLFINSVVGPQRVICSNNVEATNIKSHGFSWCSVQGAIFHFCILSAVLWWTAQAW